VLNKYNETARDLKSRLGNRNISKIAGISGGYKTMKREENDNSDLISRKQMVERILM
jgi:hypothetical protein